VDSGTEVDLTDVWGVIEEGTSTEKVWICGYKTLYETIILHGNQSGFTSSHQRDYNDYINLNNNFISGPVISIWTNNPDHIWAITYWGLYQIKTNDVKSFIRYPDQDAWGGYILNLRGNSENDIFFSGYESTIWHFNGINLHHFSEITGSAALYGMAVKDDLIVAVGDEYSLGRAVIVKGERF